MGEAALGHWLRLLWGRNPPLRTGPRDAAPFIESGALHLPPMVSGQALRAAAAHAAAHLVYSPAGFDGAGLVPIARTLLAVLEDARVEALAMRELPGLARLWRPLHTATPDSGASFDALLRRLARALVDPAYDDPHAWVRKGRRLFYLDQALLLPALRTPAELRSAALLLGHDIGQARLPFNARGPSPLPIYRDDHRWMWPADQLARVAPPPAAPSPGEDHHEPQPEAPEPPATTQTRHSEWDRLIRRLRADWVTVHEPADTASDLPQQHPPAAPDGPAPAEATLLSRRLRRVLRPLHGPMGAWRQAEDGPRVDVDALVHWHLARRAGRPGDGRVFRSPQRLPQRPAVWLLVDLSASSADGAAGGGRLLDLARQATLATADALQTLGIRCAVSGFSSQGRHAVRWHTVQALGSSVDAHGPGQALARSRQSAGGRTSPPASPSTSPPHAFHPSPPASRHLAARLQAWHSGGSTRLGAAIRHAALRLKPWRSGPRWVLLLSDAEVHDIDVHDPLYLRADARQAVQAAARQGIRVACLQLAAHRAGPADAQARQIFGARAVQALGELPALPLALQKLLAG